MVEITTPRADDIESIAVMARDAFDGTASTYSKLEVMRAEVEACLANTERIELIAEIDGEIVGWVGAEPNYGGVTWELHPLAVEPGQQGRGIGAQLVAALEQAVVDHGGQNMFVMTDDEVGRTSLGNVDIMAEPLTALMKLSSAVGHPYQFYQRQGYVLCGVIPDANGPGRPDIMLVKRLVTLPDEA